MFRLLFCTAALLPIAVISWSATSSEAVEIVAADSMDASYAELVTDPNLSALADCDMSELPVFFRDNLVTTHSAEFIHEGLEAAQDCGDMAITVVPVLPEYADASDLAQADVRAAELLEHVEATAELTSADIALDVADQPLEDDVSTLYINGRAAILRIDPEADAG